MFTGLVEAVGRIERAERRGRGMRLAVRVGRLPLGAVRIGDSICVQGACLTVVAKRGKVLRFDVSQETLACTTGLDRTGPVNLERSLHLGDPLGGHLVTGHVDGVGEVISFDSAGESKRLRLRVPRKLSRFVARKGSICVDGVSLTVNRVAAGAVDLNLILHTLEVTTLSRLAPGANVNLEVDLVARYVERMLGRRVL
ncbi:MAG: riboflavin synthase [Burkholderiales bacterium]